MSAADAREELEARLWRLGIPAPDVRVILAVADDYARAYAARQVDRMAAPDLEGRARLAEAAAAIADERRQRIAASGGPRTRKPPMLPERTARPA